MRIIGKIVRTLVLTALALVAIFNSSQPTDPIPTLNYPTTAAVVDPSLK